MIFEHHEGVAPAEGPALPCTASYTAMLSADDIRRTGHAAKFSIFRVSAPAVQDCGIKEVEQGVWGLALLSAAPLSEPILLRLEGTLLLAVHSAPPVSTPICIDGANPGTVLSHGLQLHLVSAYVLDNAGLEHGSIWSVVQIKSNEIKK